MNSAVKYIDLQHITLMYAFRDGRVSFTIVPKNKKKDVLESKLFKSSTTQYFYIDNMIQLASRGDSVKRNFSQGQTLFNSSSAFELEYVDQVVEEANNETFVKTYFRSKQYEVTNVVNVKRDYKAFTIHNEIKNIGEDIYLDRLDSCAINTITPLNETNDPDKLIVHTFDSYWSMEVRKHSEPLSRYDFYDSWSKLGIKMFRINSLGMMPARGHIPFMAIEDQESNVTWAVQLRNPDSWQIEAIHNYGSISILAGHSDYLVGHWEKLLKHNEVYKTNEVIVTVVNGGLDEACSEITRFHDFYFTCPPQEEDLPIIYNEYLYSWGKPTIEDVKKQIGLAKGLSCEAFVIDAGWFLSPHLVGEGCLGDWNVNAERFPNGLKEFTSYANQNGFITAGIWYEFEAVTSNSEIYKNHPEYLVTLNGKIVTLDQRHFLDFNKPEVLDYLREKVIKNIIDNNVNYIKLDYNENLGFEIDGPSDNKAENVRLYSQNLLAFIKETRAKKPDLVFETCSSGGMRHELSFDYAGSMTSFSDAHEILGGTMIAMDMHRIMQPRIMQVWASLLPSHDIDHIYSILAKGMLGRMCYSGRIDLINPEVYEIAKNASNFYAKIKPIIKKGNTVLIDTDLVKNIDDPVGTCELVRKSIDEESLIYYFFSFDSNKNSVDFPFDDYELVDSFTNLEVEGHHINLLDKKLGAFVGLYKRIKK